VTPCIEIKFKFTVFTYTAQSFIPSPFTLALYITIVRILGGPNNLFCFVRFSSLSSKIIQGKLNEKRAIQHQIHMPEIDKHNRKKIFN